MIKSMKILTNNAYLRFSSRFLKTFNNFFSRGAMRLGPPACNPLKSTYIYSYIYGAQILVIFFLGKLAELHNKS